MSRDNRISDAIFTVHCISELPNGRLISEIVSCGTEEQAQNEVNKFKQRPHKIQELYYSYSYKVWGKVTEIHNYEEE